MSHVIEVPDEMYAEVAKHAAERGQTPDALLLDIVSEAVAQLSATMPELQRPYDPANDPLAPFIGAFDSSDEDPGWIERHDEYFAGIGDADADQD